MAIELHHRSHIHIARRRSGAEIRTGVALQTRAAQALMLLVGIVGTFGVFYFTMVEPEPGINAGDGVVAALLLIGSLGYIAAASKLSLNDSEIWAAALGFAVLRVAMSIVKILGYGGGEAVSFLALDAAIVALLLTSRPAETSAPAQRS